MKIYVVYSELFDEDGFTISYPDIEIIKAFNSEVTTKDYCKRNTNKDIWFGYKEIELE